jgi:cysteine desulfurase
MQTTERASDIIYLDGCATTRCNPEVVAAMRVYLEEEYGNPSSAHIMGRRARRVIQQAARQVAQLIGASEEEIVFTSGATEANNIALFSSFAHEERAPINAILSPIEHKSVLHVGRELERRGLQIQYLEVGPRGQVSLASLAARLDPHTRIVSVGHVNAELGTIQPVEQMARLTRASSALLHVDAVQSAGKIPLDVKEIGADMLSLSAHKLHGPKGVGALYVRSQIAGRLRPFILGGDQSRLRSGTLPTPLIAGLGLACQIAGNTLAERESRTATLRDFFLARLKQAVPDLRVNTDLATSTPYVLNLQLPGVSAEALVSGLQKVAISSASACNSATLEPSHVLTAIGLTREQASSSVRICLDASLTRELLEEALGHLISKINAIRQENRECYPARRSSVTS